MKRLRRSSLPRFYHLLPALALAGVIVFCAGWAAAQGSDPPSRSGERPADRPADRPVERTEGSTDIRPTRPDVYYLRDKDGKLVPVPDFSYEDFKRLYDLDRKLTDAAAPPKHVLSQLQVTGQIEGEQAVLQVQVRVTAKTEGWTSIPLRFSGAILRNQPQYDGPGKLLVEYHRERDGYVVWLQESDSQPHRITFEAVAPVRRNGASRRLAFSAPSTAVSELRLRVPGTRISATVSEGAGLLSSKAIDAQSSELVVAGIGGDFQLNWLDTPVDTTVIAPTLEATSAIMVRVEGPRRLTSEARLKVRSYGVPLTAFRVKLPAGLEWFPLTEPGYRVNLVETLRTEGLPPTQVVEVTLDAKNSYFAEVRLRSVSPAREAAADERVETLGFDVQGAVRQFGQADFVVDGDWSVTWPQRENVQQVEVPDALRQQRVAARFEYFRQPCSLGVLVQPRKTRVTVEPDYTLRVGPQTMRLETVLRYRVRGPSADRVVIDLAGWKLDQLLPESLVDRDLIREGPGGTIILPLSADPSVAMQEFELRLEMSRPTTLTDDVLSAPLPRPQADTFAPARLRVAPAENVSLSPRPRDMPGGVAPLLQEPSAGGTGPNTLVFQLRGDVEQPRFVANYQLRARQITVALDQQVQIESRRLLVEQRHTCRVAFEPLRYFRLQIPEPFGDAAFQAGIELPDGEVDALPVVNDPPGPTGQAGDPTIRAIDLGQERLGTFVLVVRYSIPWEVDADESGATLAHVPLLLPVADPATRLAANRVRLTRDPSWQSDVSDSLWTPEFRSQEDARDAAFSAAGWVDDLPLEITSARGQAGSGTVVRQAWVQSWFGLGWRQDRVVLRVQSSDRRLVVSLPPDMERDDLLVAVDGRRVRPSFAADGATMRIDWSPAEPSAEQTVELSYLAPRNDEGYGRLRVVLPKIVGARGEQRWHWQLVLPPNEHLASPPAGWVAQRRWLWQAGFLDQRMSTTQGELERALAASAQVEPPADANQYLFSCFAPDSMVEVRVVDRTVMVLLASGLLLAVGLGALYLAWLRHPALLLACGVGGLAAALVAPSLAVLLLQAGTLGVVLALCGFLLRRLIRRRQGTRTVVRGSALSVGDKPLSDFRTGRSDSKYQATTATAPPTLALLICGGLAWSAAGELRAQGPAGPPGANATLENAKSAAATEPRLPSFRRVLVREEQVPELARGHLPIAREEFDSLLEAVRKQLPSGAPATRIEQADYIVRWESPASLVGEARLKIAHEASQPGLLTLDPCDLPVLDAHWNVGGASSGREPADSAPARVGATSSGAACVIVDRAGILHWRFTLQPDRDAKGGRFRVRLPHTARQRWWLELPDPLTPQFTDGVLIGPGADSLVRDAPESVRATAGRVWWCLEAGGRTELDWTARSPAAGEPWTPAFTWRHETQYDMSLQGLEWRTTLRLDVSAAPLNSLTCDIPVDVRMASVRLGDAPVPWTVRPSALEGRAELTLELTELQGSDRVLVLTALADPPLGARYTLPRLDCRGGFWLDGHAVVTVAEPLQIQAFDVRGGRQTSVTSLATPLPAVSLGVQLHDAESAIELRAAAPAPHLKALVGTSVDVDNSTVTARAVAAISAVRGRPFRITADVASAWSVDSIDVQPESLLEDYAFEPAPGTDRQRLVLRLRNPLTRDRPLRLSVHAHRPRSADQDAVTVDALRVLDFPSAAEEVVETRRLVALNSKPDAPLEFRGDADVVWLSADQLAGPEAELLNTTAEYLFVDGREAAGLRGRVASAPAAYSAEVEVQALTLPGRLQERYRIACTPRGAPVSRLIVLFSNARSAPLSWQLDDDEVNIPAARRLADRELAAVTRAAGEGWEVVLNAPRSRPFVLRAERTSPWTERRPLALVSLPESETQQGTIRIEANGAAPIVSQQGLEAAPTGPEDAARGSDWLAAFRYAPANVPTVTLTPSQRAEGTAAWAWASELKTYYMGDGRAFHRAAWWIETEGTRQFQARLPAGAEEVQLTVNGSPRSLAVEPTAVDVKVMAPLPMSVRQVVVELTFRTREAPLGWGRELTPISLQLDIPEAARVWIPCLPANYRAWDDATGWSSPRPSGGGVWAWWSALRSRLTALFLDPADGRSAVRDANAPGGEPGEGMHLWTRYSLAAGDGQPPKLRVVNSDLLRGCAWALLLCVAGATAWSNRTAGRWAPLGLAALLAILPWLPTSWDPTPSAVLSGLTLGMAASWIRRVRVEGRERRLAEGSTSGLRWANAANLALLAAAWIGDGPTPLSHAQEKSPPIYEVLYPVDEEGRPVDDYVHVPQAFYQELRRRTRGQAAALPGWLWRSARYRALVRDTAELEGESQAGWEIASITAQWDVDVTASDQRVALPARVAWNTLLSQRILREGQDVDAALEWNGENWGVLLTEPGRYQIQAVWRPTLKLRTANDAGNGGTMSSTRWGVSQPIPRIADCRLTVEFPDGERWVEVAGARGAVVRDEQAREIRAELGPIESLSLEGAAGPGGASGNPTLPVEVEQLAWFQLRPGAVTLDVVWKYASLQGPLPRSARVTLDPRLRLLPAGPDQPAGRLVAGEGGTSVLQWEWDEATGSSARVRFSFLVAGAMGIGQWRLPKLEPWNARVAQRWMAVSSSPNLDTSRGGGSALQPIPPAEFIEAWGESANEAPATPQYAYRVKSVDQAWSLATRLRGARLLAAQTTQLGVDRDRSRLQWAADVEVGEGQVWSHVIETPVDLNITDVTLLDRAGEENRLLQWSRIAPDQIQILLNAPLSGAHRVQVSGDLPTPLERPWTFPTLTLADAPLTAHRCVVYRSPAVTVDWETKPRSEFSAREEEVRAGWGRRIADWSPPGPENLLQEAAAVLQVHENRPRVRGRLGTIVAAGQDGFRTEISGQLTVEAGELDALRIETPAEWPEDLEMEPQWGLTWNRVPKGGRKVMVLRPAQPWTGKVEFRIRGPAMSPRADRFPLPDLRLLDVDAAEYYLWLPRQTRDRPLAWDTSGLQATRWPEGLAFTARESRPPEPRSEAGSAQDAPSPERRGNAESAAAVEAELEQGTAYRVVSSRIRVSLLDEDAPRGRPGVGLADHRVFLNDAGAGWGISTLDVESAGEAECVLELPERCELIQLLRDGRRTRRQALGPRQWRVELAPAGWTQRLEVVFRVDAEPLGTTERARTAPVASIIDWPAACWLLTVQAWGDVEAGDGRLADSDSVLLAQDLARLDAWSQCASRAAEALLSHPPQDAAKWWPAWRSRFEERRRAILPHDPPREDRERLAERSSQAARERMEQAETRLRVADAAESSGASPPETLRPAEQGEPALERWRAEAWERASRASTRTSDLRWAFTHDPGPLVLRWRASDRQRERAAWLWTGLWCGGGLAWLTLAWSGRIGLWWARWPQVVVAIAGVACWWATSWPWLGLALVAVGVLAALRGEWGYRVQTSR
ncbi:MAG: hypothetical protein U0939_13285 [Pirellulales bacterium]